jgi:uncharacterized protein
VAEGDLAQKKEPQVGLTFEDAHFPGRAPLDSYGNGGFRFAEMSHRGSILCLPSGIHAWAASEPGEIDVKSLAPLFAEEGTEILLVGTGTDLVPLPKKLIEACEVVGIRAEPMSTGAAARTFNVLLAEGRAVSAALLAVA